MIISIKPSNKLLFDVLIENQSFFSIYSYESKTNLLNSAIEKLESDIIDIANEQKDSHYYNFFWQFTYDIHRDDGLKDTVTDYYLLEILEFLKKEYSIEKVEVFCKLSRPLVAKISQTLPVELKIESFFRIKQYFRYKIGALKYINLYFIHAVKDVFNNYDNNYGKSVMLFFTNDRFNITRLKNITNLLDEKFNIYLLNFSLTRFKKLGENKLFNIKSYSLKMFFKSYIETFRFYKYFKKSFSDSKFDSLYSELLKQQSFLQSFFLILRFNALNYIFRNINVSFVTTNTTIGDPNKRMVTFVARSNNITTITFACRPFLSYLRVEDRVINLDFDVTTDSFFVDKFILFDKVSKNHLINSGVKPSKIYSYNEKLKNSELKKIKEGVLLLFASSNYNEKLIDLFIQLKNKGVILGNVYYREHPNKGLTNSHKKRFKSVFNNAICLNSYKWEEILFKKVVAFSSNSTSAIEASARGTGIVWLPFLTEQSLQFKPMMEAIGEICFNTVEFFDFMFKLSVVETKVLFIEKCNKQYSSNIDLKSTIEDFILDL